MSLATNVTNLATRTATEAKSLRTLINGNQSSLADLKTTEKTNLVAAINELLTMLAGAGVKISDTTTSTTTVWSSSKTNTKINDAVSALVDSSPEALDTLKELAAALGNDSNFSKTIMDAIAAKASKDSPTFTGTVTVPDDSFTLSKIAGLQAELDKRVALFADPNADAIFFWDDSASKVAPLSLSGLTINNTVLSVIAASETVAGVAERATLAEVTAGTDAIRFVTPQGLRQEINTRAASTHTHTTSQLTDFATAVPAAVPSASESVAGKVELASSVEAVAGVDSARAVTPAGVKAVADTKADKVHGHALTDSNITGVLPIAQVPTGTSGTTVALGNHGHTSANISDFGTAVDGRVNALVPTATVTAPGKIELATDIEVASGTDISRAITPATLRGVMGDPEANFVSIFEAALV